MRALRNKYWTANEACEMSSAMLGFVVIRRTGGKQNTQQFARFLRIHDPDPWSEPIELVSVAFNLDGRPHPHRRQPKSRDGLSTYIDLVSQALHNLSGRNVRRCLIALGFRHSVSNFRYSPVNFCIHLVCKCFAF